LERFRLSSEELKIQAERLTTLRAAIADRAKQLDDVEHTEIDDGGQQRQR